MLGFGIGRSLLSERGPEPALRVINRALATARLARTPWMRELWLSPGRSFRRGPGSSVCASRTVRGIGGFGQCTSTQVDVEGRRTLMASKRSHPHIATAVL